MSKVMYTVEKVGRGDKKRTVKGYIGDEYTAAYMRQMRVQHRTP
jgi:hypothetical protein